MLTPNGSNTGNHGMKADASLEKCDFCVDRTGTKPLGGFFEFDDGKVLSAAVVADDETEGNGIVASRLEPRHLPVDTEKHVHRYATIQPLMRPPLVVPVRKEIDIVQKLRPGRTETL